MTEILAPGTRVTIGDDVPAQVLFASIGPVGLTYTVAWWSGRDRKEATLYPFELTAYQDAETIAIGFRSPNGRPHHL